MLILVDLDDARKALYKTQDRRNALSDNIAKAKAFLAADFGPNDVFAPVYGRCVEGQIDDTTYEVCLYGRIMQKFQGNSWNIGKFERWADEDGDGTPDHFKQMYENGDWCQETPNRATNVCIILFDL